MTESCNHRPNINYICVEKVPIFNHLSLNEMEKIVNLSRTIKLHKGELLYREGDVSNYLYIIHVGSVKIYQLFESGKEQLLRILYPGEFMGELSLFTNKKMDSFAEAMTDAEICAIHKQDMERLMQAYPTIAIKILEQFSLRLEETEKLIGQLSAKDVETRTANYLLDLVKKENTLELVLPMSKKDLASYLGTTRETISRRLSVFQMNGWISQEGHRQIKIIDYDALAAIVVENNY